MIASRLTVASFQGVGRGVPITVTEDDPGVFTVWHGPCGGNQATKVVTGLLWLEAVAYAGNKVERDLQGESQTCVLRVALAYKESAAPGTHRTGRRRAVTVILAPLERGWFRSPAGDPVDPKWDKADSSRKAGNPSTTESGIRAQCGSCGMGSDLPGLRWWGCSGWGWRLARRASRLTPAVRP